MSGGKMLNFREAALLAIPYKISEDSLIDYNSVWRFTFRAAVENVSFGKRLGVGSGY